MALLALEDLRVEYRTARGTSGAVDGVTAQLSEGELVGLTESQAHLLRHEKDVRYLRAP